MTVTDGRSCAVFLLLALFCAGCVTETKSNERSSFMSSMKHQPAEKEKPAGPSRDTTAARSAPAAQDAPEPAPPRTEHVAPKTTPTPRNTGNAPAPNSRVMFYQPKGDLLLILVNESHTGRTTEAGRLELALNDANRAYKILSDAQMQALLQSLVAAGYDQNATDFVPDDAQYLTSASADLPRYQGLISVERGGSKTKVLGYRRASEGDALGLRRYQSYTQLKGLVQKWFGDSSRSEYPVGGVSLPR